MTRAPWPRWPAHQLPVLSPLTPGAIAAGVAATLPVQGRRAESGLVDLLCREFAAAGAILCSSGTDALQRALACVAGRVGRPLTVALPAYSCFDVATAAVGVNARIVLYDVVPRTLAPEPDSFERACAAADATVIAPLFGIPVAWEELACIATRQGATLIEDAAQGSGGLWRGQPLGSLGQISTLSFGRGKGWTGGSGGALLLRDRTPDALPAAAGLREEARTLAAAVAQFTFGRPGVYGLLAALPWLQLGETVYHPPTPPRGMPRSAAAIALATQGRVAAGRSRRLAVAAEYGARLRLLRHVDPVDVPDGGDAGYLRFPVRVRDGVAAVRSRPELRRMGIMPGYPVPLYALSPVRERLVDVRIRCRGAEELAGQLITLPTHQRVTSADQDRILQAFGLGPARSSPLRVAAASGAA